MTDLGGRKALTTWLGLLVSAAALTGVIVWISNQEAPTFPTNIEALAALAGAVGIYGAATVLRGERWWWLLSDAQAQASRREAYELTAVGYMGNNVLPARAGDVMRVVLLKGGRRVRRSVIGTLVAERVLDVIFLLSLFALLAFAVLRGIETPKAGFLVMAAGIATVVAGIAGGLLWLHRDRPRIARLLAFLSPLLLPTRRLKGRHLRLMGLQTAGVWTLEIAAYVVIARALDIEMSFVEGAYLIAVASVFLLIPSGPGYVGTLDAALLFGLDAIGVTGTEAVSYLLTLRFVVFVPITLAGLSLFLWRFR